MMTMPPLASIKDIDTNFDFTSDSKNFWNGFWDTKRNGGFGSGGSDPDSASMMLRHYHFGILPPLMTRILYRMMRSLI